MRELLERIQACAQVVASVVRRRQLRERGAVDHPPGRPLHRIEHVPERDCVITRRCRALRPARFCRSHGRAFWGRWRRACCVRRGRAGDGPFGAAFGRLARSGGVGAAAGERAIWLLGNHRLQFPWLLRSCVVRPPVHWCENSLLGRVAPMEPGDHGPQVNALLLGPCGNRFGFTVYGEPSSRTAVSRLLAPSGPATVLRGISRVIVDPFDRVLCARSSSHVREEYLIRRSPSGANRDASAAVPIVMRDSRIGAATHHLSPQLAFGLIPELALCSDAPATLRLATRQATSSNEGFFAAIAPATPNLIAS